MTSADELLDSFTYDGGNADEYIGVTNREHRENILHYCRHIFAFLLVAPYVVMTIYCVIYAKNICEIPDAYLALVSAVCGFYFGNYIR